MMSRFQHRIPRLLAVTVVALFAVAAVAFAGKPVKGATYTGKITRVIRAAGKTYRSSFSISFNVSASGKKVSGFTLPQGYPVYCQGGGFASPQAGSGKISSKGKFTVKLPLYFAPTHQHQGFVIVTGAFGKRGAESGKVKTAFSKAKVCNGTASYKTKG
jgi:hypothetical protein